MTLVQTQTDSPCGCEDLDHSNPLISVEAALARISDVTCPVTETERVPVASAAGRVLAASVQSLGMVPPFCNAAMDGYAINSGELLGSGPWELPVEGRVAAGQEPAGHLPHRCAIQVFTGAPIPLDADAVVMQEHVVRTGDRMRLSRSVIAGQHIRRAGEDMSPGDIVLPAGRRLSPHDIAACAAAGHGSVRVTRRVTVALVITGDEVVAAGQPRSPSAIWDVNTPMMSAALTAPGLDLVCVQTARDTRTGLKWQLSDLAERVDLIVTTGGISVGEEDHVKPALAELGGSLDFSGVSLKPGKPVSFGRIGRARWIGLPGNPLSAFVTWQIFGVPVCEALSGQAQARTRRRKVVLARALHHKPGRAEFRLGRVAETDELGRDIVDFADSTQSGQVAQLSRMAGVVCIPAKAGTVPGGTLVEFLPF